MKNRTAHNCAIGIIDTASGYVMKAKAGPVEAKGIMVRAVVLKGVGWVCVAKGGGG